MINKKPLFRHLTQREWRGCWTCLTWRSSPPGPSPTVSGAGAGTALGQGSTSPACRWMEDRLSLVTKQWHVLFIAGKWRSRGEQGNLGQEWHGGAGWRHGLDHWQLGLQSRGVHSLRAGEDEVQAVWRVSWDKDEPARGNFPPREDDGESCQGGQQFSVLCFKRTYLFCCTFPWNIFRIDPRAFFVTITLSYSADSRGMITTLTTSMPTMSTATRNETPLCRWEWVSTDVSAVWMNSQCRYLDCRDHILNILSMGFGFVNYLFKASSGKPLKTLQHSRLGDHCLELKRSTRAGVN